MAEASLQSYSMADAAAHVHADNTCSFAAAVAAPDGQTDAAPDAAADDATSLAPAKAAAAATRDARDADMTSVSVSADVGFIPEVCIYHLASGDMCDNFYRWLHASETSELAATRAT